MANEHTTADGGTGADRTARSRRHRALRAALWVVAGALVLAGAGLGLVHLRLDGNISDVDIDSALGTDRPADVPGGSLDILVLGSDTRSGDNGRYGRDDGTARSDTAMIVHIAESHDRASVVSIPRDTLVRRPACEKTGGGTAAAEPRTMFNKAYEIGGPVCAVKTAESLTGIRMDHYIEIDFTGFKKLIDELGGVEITTSRPIDDEDSHLTLPPGDHTLDGEQALGLVRTRKSIGNGSDLGRIDLQHKFVRALVEQVRSVGVLSEPKRFYDLVDTATSAVTTDSGLASTAELAGLGKVLKGIDSEDIQLVTLPVRYSEADPNRVEPIQRGAQRIWTALRADEPVPASATEGSIAP
ncbi:transcriptional regulator [Streptomyces carminius]|uniref:Transcriptional regulator n=1 Tax=Streptomyces carminius TaxID=2665496 RepID=A0A2M8LVS3_9ACTN|nr:LCP family protein [Streptomyces carminius]PJE96061.1 transcriptional regulator [Streptomyces carminius]